MTEILSTLATFGITPTRYPTVFLAVLIIAGVVYIRSSLGTPLETMKENIGKMKENILVIVTHLTTSTRSKLNPALIKSMSPLQIQPDGQKILQESGFIGLFDIPLNRKRFFSIIESNKPVTKLEVESWSIYSFTEVMYVQGALTQVQNYLYEHPDVRETFPTLAGVYIRDRYLEGHPEIV